jgi:hypothetical protein
MKRTMHSMVSIPISRNDFRLEMLSNTPGEPARREKPPVKANATQEKILKTVIACVLWF